jgi:glycosyltransferase involved in cell wall biosynthesis
VFLTIGIPTHNGAKTISIALDSVLKAIQFDANEDVEILISDNCSTDSTREVITEFQSKYPNLLKYVRQETNQGYDRNVINIVDNSTGEFIWLLGDDDTCTISSIAEIRERATALPSVSVLLCRVDYINLKTGILLKAPRLESEHLTFTSKDEFFTETLWNSSPISAICFRRNLVDPIKLASGVGSNWIHLEIVMQALSLNPNAIFIRNTMAICGLENDRWTDHFGEEFSVGLVHLTTLKKMLGLGFQHTTFEKFLESRLKGILIAALFYSPRSNRERASTIKLLHNLFPKSAKVKSMVIPLVLMPNFSKRFIRSTGRRIKHLVR